MRCFRFRTGTWTLGNKVYILAIMNVTPDSFSDGSAVNQDPGYQVDKAMRLVEEGADALDLGAESTRPGHTAITAEEEWARLGPVLKAVRLALPDVPLSIDTQKSWVAERALDAGADIVNDIWGFSHDERMPALVARYGAGAVLMYNEDGDPESPINGERLQDFFRRQVQAAQRAGVSPEALLLDPGIGFRVQGEASWAILGDLHQFEGIGSGILVGHSRKRFLGRVAGIPEAAQRDGVTAALSTLLAAEGHTDVLRVHNPRTTREAILVAQQWRRFHGAD